MSITIETENPATPDIACLLTEHLSNMSELSPPESVHALDLSALQSSNISFFTARATQSADSAATAPGQLMGCAALQTLSANTGELKSMRTVTKHLRKGVAAALLQHVIQIAREQGLTELCLETGTPEAFQPARNLYLQFGFTPCPPFGNYTEDLFSVCMRLPL